MHGISVLFCLVLVICEIESRCISKCSRNAKGKNRFEKDIKCSTGCTNKRGPPVCLKWCPLSYPSGWYGHYCCLYRDRPGECPMGTFCETPFPEIFTVNMKCNNDFDCSYPTKCCSANCYAHKICKFPTLATTSNVRETVIIDNTKIYEKQPTAMGTSITFSNAEEKEETLKGIEVKEESKKGKETEEVQEEVTELIVAGNVEVIKVENILKQQVEEQTKDVVKDETEFVQVLEELHETKVEVKEKEVQPEQFENNKTIENVINATYVYDVDSEEVTEGIKEVTEAVTHENSLELVFEKKVGVTRKVVGVESGLENVFDEAKWKEKEKHKEEAVGEVTKTEKVFVEVFEENKGINSIIKAENKFITVLEEGEKKVHNVFEAISKEVVEEVTEIINTGNVFEGQFKKAEVIEGSMVETGFGNVFEEVKRNEIESVGGEKVTEVISDKKVFVEVFEGGSEKEVAVDKKDVFEQKTKIEEVIKGNNVFEEAFSEGDEVEVEKVRNDIKLNTKFSQLFENILQELRRKEKENGRELIKDEKIFAQIFQEKTKTLFPELWKDANENKAEIRFLLNQKEVTLEKSTILENINGTDLFEDVQYEEKKYNKEEYEVEKEITKETVDVMEAENSFKTEFQQVNKVEEKLKEAIEDDYSYEQSLEEEEEVEVVGEGAKDVIGVETGYAQIFETVRTEKGEVRNVIKNENVLTKIYKADGTVEVQNVAVNEVITSKPGFVIECKEVEENAANENDKINEPANGFEKTFEAVQKEEITGKKVQVDDEVVREVINANTVFEDGGGALGKEEISSETGYGKASEEVEKIEEKYIIEKEQAGDVTAVETEFVEEHSDEYEKVNYIREDEEKYEVVEEEDEEVNESEEVFEDFEGRENNVKYEMLFKSEKKFKNELGEKFNIVPKVKKGKFYDKDKNIIKTKYVFDKEQYSEEEEEEEESEFKENTKTKKVYEEENEEEEFSDEIINNKEFGFFFKKLFADGGVRKETKSEREFTEVLGELIGNVNDEDFEGGFEDDNSNYQTAYTRYF